jgi:hypothetical protein
MNLITPKEMESLKKLAADNLETALLAAARFGATKSAEAAKPIKRAAEILEYEAEELKSIGFRNEADKQDYAERKKIAKQLREMIEAKL